VGFPKVKHAASMGAILGAVGPLLYYTTQPAREFILGNGLFLWPTGLINIVTYGHEHDFFGYAVTTISIALNIALYAAIMVLLWFIVRIVYRAAATKRERDVNT
jgi:high-affinity K+ transport system ATPase subunit B